MKVVEATDVRTKRRDPRDWRTVSPFVTGLCLFVLLAAFNEWRSFELWRNYALSGVFLGAPVTWSLWHYDVRIPHYIQWIIVAGLLLHYGGGSVGSPDPYSMGLFGMHGINGAYHVFGWWDNLTHGVGIGAGTMAIAYLLEGMQLRRGLAWRAWWVALIAGLAGLTAGVAVELYEFLGKTVFQTIDQGGYANTMTDLLFNLLGATLGALAAVAVNRGMFWGKIQAQWGQQRSGPMGMPANMTGLLAFVTIPALTSLGLGLHFLAVPDGDYDAALGALTQAALGAAVVGVGTAIAKREWDRRKEAT